MKKKNLSIFKKKTWINQLFFGQAEVYKVPSATVPLIENVNVILFFK